MTQERWHEDTEESWLYVDRGRDWTDAVISQGRPCLPEAGKDKDGSSSKSFVRYVILPTPWFQTSGLQSWEIINLFAVLCEGCPGTLRGCLILLLFQCWTASWLSESWQPCLGLLLQLGSSQTHLSLLLPPHPSLGLLSRSLFLIVGQSARPALAFILVYSCLSDRF